MLFTFGVCVGELVSSVFRGAVGCALMTGAGVFVSVRWGTCVEMAVAARPDSVLVEPMRFAVERCNGAVVAANVLGRELVGLPTKFSSSARRVGSSIRLSCNSSAGARKGYNASPGLLSRAAPVTAASKTKRLAPDTSRAGMASNGIVIPLQRFNLLLLDCITLAACPVHLAP